MKLLSVYEGSLRFFSSFFFFWQKLMCPFWDMRLNYVFVMFLTYASKKLFLLLIHWLMSRIDRTCCDGLHGLIRSCGLRVSSLLTINKYIKEKSYSLRLDRF